jgi:hypothetical protein
VEGRYCAVVEAEHPEILVSIAGWEEEEAAAAEEE